jgi:hypothetical protein
MTEDVEIPRWLMRAAEQVKTASVQEVLEGAIGKLEERGWCQHPETTLESTTGSICASQAISLEVGSRLESIGSSGPRLIMAAHLAMGWEIQRRKVEIMSVPDWNDDPATTMDEVYDVLRAAAKDMANLHAEQL